ncbi:MAG TPA: ATP-dependent helicase, partial [Pseudolysinimonas sp.]|nr:ATP-dependent helicase [Pseudolysinimonas sp.]
LALLMRKAGIQAATQRVTPTSDAVVALIGDRADYVKPVPRAAAPQQGGGRSQGANAQRKRAARVSGDAQLRADRSGRPARSGGRSGAASGAGRPARTGSGATASTRGGSSSYYSTSTGGGSQSNRPAPTGNPRRGGRRAQG